MASEKHLLLLRGLSATCFLKRRHFFTGAACYYNCRLERLINTTKQLDLLDLHLRERAGNLAMRKLLALDVTEYALHDIRVCQRHHVSNISEVGDRSKDPAHDLARAGLGHIRDDPDMLRSGDLPDLNFNRPGHLLLDLLTRVKPRLQRNVHLYYTSAQLVHQRHPGGLCDLVDGETRRLKLFRSQPVTGHIDHIVDPAKDAEIAVGCQNSTVTSEVRPVMPVFTLLVPAVLLIVDLHKSLRLAPDRLKDAWPWVADAHVAGPSASGLDHIAFFIVDHGVDPKDSRAAAARLHRLQGRQGAAQEATVLGLPPGVDDDRFALSDDVVIPAPDFRLNRLSHGCHVLEMVVVFLRLVGTDLAQHANCRRSGVEDGHAELLGDPPGTARIGIQWHPFVHHTRRPKRQGTVDDVGVPGDPPDVGEAPVRVLGVNILVVL